MSKLSVENALALWEQANLLDKSKAEELARYLEKHSPHDGWSRAVKVFSVLGAVIAGLGIILFVASHWSGMGPLLRVITLFISYGAVIALAALTEQRGYGRVASALWLLATLSLGANIFLLGQIFNFSLTFWQGPFLWMLGALAMGYATQSRLHAWLVIPLAILTLGWLGGGRGWFSDDQWEFLYQPWGLKPLFSILGLGLICLGLLAQRSQGWRFAGATWLIWGTLLVAIPLVLSTIHPELFEFLLAMEGSPKQWMIILSVAALLILAVLYGHFDARQNWRVLAIVTVFLLAIYAFNALGYSDALENRFIFLAYAISVLALSILLIWSAVMASNTWLVNLGIASAALLILIQYFSWSLQLLDRSIAFILGGFVLIALSIGVEKKRRELLSRIAR
jgi:uncharacterized membrane protein